MDAYELPGDYLDSSQESSLSDEESSPDPIPTPSSLSDVDPKGFRDGHAPRPNDVFIAVMGVAGSGKSSFISKCSGKTARIGNDLVSCTSIVDVYPYEVSPDFTVYLIDTPGFDDTTKSDSDVLKEIASWLSASYKDKIRLHGIVYLHRIIDVRMQGSARKNLVMFKELCGQDALKKVILTSTMWDKIPLKEAAPREQELKDTPEFWGWMLQKGSSCHRHDNTAESAQRIILSLANHDTPIATDLQRQLVDEGRTLEETSAGLELKSELLKERKKLAKVREELEAQIKAAKKQHDRDTQEVLQEERDRYTVLIREAEKNTKALEATMQTLIAQRDQRVSEMKNEIRDLQVQHDQTLRHMKTMEFEIEKKRAELQEKQQSQAKQQLALTSSQQVPLRTAGQSYQKGEVKNSAINLGYSVHLCSGFYFLLSPECYHTNSSKIPRVYDGKAIQFGSFAVGALDAKWTGWISRHANTTWAMSTLCEQLYPDFNSKIALYGFDNLDLCALGPDGSYYARWLDGSWSSAGSDNFNKQTTNITNNGYKIVAVSLGFGGSFLISFESSTGYREHCHDFQGYYPNLSEFLHEKASAGKNISILAATLDPHSKMDYLVIFTSNQGRKGNRPRRKFHITNSVTFEALEAWWGTTKENREESGVCALM